MTQLDGKIAGPLAGRALPLIDLDNEPFFTAAARGELLVQRCVDTGRYQHYPRALSAYTGGLVEWVKTSGRGIVYSFSIIRQNPIDPVFGSLVPYVVALIDLEAEGARMMGNITGCDVSDVRIGMPVEAHFACVDQANGIYLPFWRLSP